MKCLLTIWKFAIGQRAFLLETPMGNVLWDLITLLDDATVEFVCFDAPPSAHLPFPMRSCEP